MHTMNEHALGRRLARALGSTAAVGVSVAVGVAGAPAALAMSSPASHGNIASRACGPASSAYVEVNNEPIGAVGSYVLPDGSNVFDVAVIFAANINYDGDQAQLHFNENVQRTLDDQETIDALQEKGIKVTLSILGNHQGAGLANFESAASATAFAVQVADAVDDYGLDGVDLDDEYSEYGKNGTAMPNDDSIGWLVSALRDEMPSKIISFYSIGPSGESLEHGSADIGSQLTYATNPYYGSYDAPAIPGLGDAQLSPAAVDIQSTSTDLAATLAQRTMDDGYGMFMTYNLPDGDMSGYISSFTEILYGQPAVYAPDSSREDPACVTTLKNGVLTREPATGGNGRGDGSHQGQDRPGHQNVRGHSDREHFGSDAQN